MQKLPLIIAFVFFAAFSFAQKKKTIKKLGIKTITSTEITGKTTIKDNKSTYDINGQQVEEVKYDKEGKFKSLTKFKYNRDGDVTEEIEYNEAGRLTEKRTMKYDALGEKTEELVLDKDGKQIKKITYSYNSKGLRTEKKTFDAKNTLISTKKITYTFK